MDGKGSREKGEKVGGGRRELKGLKCLHITRYRCFGGYKSPGRRAPPPERYIQANVRCLTRPCFLLLGTAETLRPKVVACRSQRPGAQNAHIPEVAG